MKRSVCLLALFLLAGGLAFSMEDYETPFLKRLNFTDEEISRLVDMQQEAQAVILRAQAEVDVYRAQIKKALLASNPNLKEIEKLLREAMEWEIKIRMAEIEKEIKARSLLGDKKWAMLVRALRERAEAQREKQWREREAGKERKEKGKL